MNQEAFKYLNEAYTKAVEDDDFKDDQVRFKVQEMHFLNELFNHYSSIEYSADKQQTWFEFSKTIRNNILVELNINALSEVYNLNTTIFKDVIGSLNWKKFAERIKAQLVENQLLTSNQRKSMQVNVVISMIKSNMFDEAKAMLKNIRKQPEYANSTEFQTVFDNLDVFFLVKDKKYQEALQLVPSSNSNGHTVLLRA